MQAKFQWRIQGLVGIITDWLCGKKKKSACSNVCLFSETYREVGMGWEHTLSKPAPNHAVMKTRSRCILLFYQLQHLGGQLKTCPRASCRRQSYCWLGNARVPLYTGRRGILSSRVLLPEDGVIQYKSRYRGGRTMGNWEGCSSGNDIKVPSCQWGKGMLSSLLPPALAWTRCQTLSQTLPFFCSP